MIVASIVISSVPTISAADEFIDFGKDLFVEHCARCHGIDASGKGPDAADLKTVPADLTKISERRGGVWPMLEVMSILDGYLKVQEPRYDMPIITELNDGPNVEFDTGNGLVTRIPSRLIEIAEYLESIQSPKPERYVP
ncbi:c-type cytochrome [Ruegeria arenilitoris]|uniref:c-type cytochrome n=1 Tax=Ruegeria arenilitoris TaxID=1173585 RepID=UPI00147A9E7F|nr:cytochrome c [Ruegeria arenilitoris]